MKKWIASILCLVMVLSSISALAALPAPDASKKPAEVTVNITEDADGYLLLTVSDGGKDYYVHGSFITDRSDNKNATFSWNDEKNAYVSYSPVKGYSGKYNYVEVNNGYGTSSIYRQIGGEIYDSYVAINKYEFGLNSKTDFWSYWYSDGRTASEKTVSVHDDKGQIVSSLHEQASYDKDGNFLESFESSMKATWTDKGHTEEQASKKTRASGNVTNSKSIEKYDENWNQILSSSESTTHDKDGKLTEQSESSTKYTWTDKGHKAEEASKKTSSSGNVTEAKSVYEYNEIGNQTSYSSESTTHNKDGKLTSSSKTSRDSSGNYTRTNTSYSESTGARTSQSTEIRNDKKGTSVITSERYNTAGLLLNRSKTESDKNSVSSSSEYYYSDGSLRMKTSDKEVSDGNKGTVTGDRYNSSNTLVYALKGTRTYDPETGFESSHDLTYTNADGAKIGWDVYDAKTGKTDYRLPYSYDTDWNQINSESASYSNAYARNGDVATWRTYTYDPATGKETELSTNYKGQKLFESSRTNENGTSTEYWLRTQKPYKVTASKDGRTEESYQTTRGLEWQKKVTDDSGDYTASYYNSKGELTYKYEAGKYYFNNGGQLEELEDGLRVMTGGRYTVTGFMKNEPLENGYKETYYDLDKKVTGSREYTDVTEGNTTTSTFIEYDADGNVTDKNVTVTKSEETEKGNKTTVTTNGIVTRISENIYNDDGTRSSRAKEYNEKTGLITAETIHLTKGNTSTDEYKYYNSKGNLSHIYREVSKGDGITKIQDLDGNKAIASYGTVATSQGHTVTKSYWAVGGLRNSSDWYSDGLRMPDVSSEVGTSSSFDENGRYTYWSRQDADGNSSVWDYYEGDVVSSIQDRIYNSDGSLSEHRQYFNFDGSTDFWLWTDSSEDNQYVTERKWDGNEVLLYTEVTEATKEGQTVTLTDPYGNRKVTKYDMNGQWLSEEKNYTGSDGWKYAFGEWKYIQNGNEVAGEWKNVNGTWYYFNWDGSMATANIGENWKKQADGTLKAEKVYAINEDGTWLSTPGWNAIDENNWAYVNADGTAATGWQNIGGTWYHFDNNGYMNTGDFYDKADGVTYHLNEDGAWVTLNGWYEDDGFWKHYTNDVKDTGWFNDGNWYYLSGDTGSMVSDAWLEVDDKWYLFDENGAMETGWVDKDGSWYYMNQDGALAEGWVQDGGWYYMTESGMATGWKVIDGNWEYFNEDGTWSYTWGPAE